MTGCFTAGRFGAHILQVMAPRICLLPKLTYGAGYRETIRWNNYDIGIDIDYDANGSFYCIKTISKLKSGSILKGNPPFIRLSPRAAKYGSHKQRCTGTQTQTYSLNILLSVNNGCLGSISIAHQCSKMKFFFTVPQYNPAIAS